jgi:hypothetical protein
VPWSHHALSTGRSEGPLLGGATTRPCPWRSALALAGLRSGGTGSATPGRRAGRARDGAPLGSRESHGAVVAEASRDAGGGAPGVSLAPLASHRAQLFRVELASEDGRVHQVTKQHGELVAFCLGRERFNC